MSAHASIAAVCAAAVSLVVAACGVPRLRVETPDAEAPVYLDGRLAGHGRVDTQAAYYGRVEIEVAPPKDAPLSTLAARALVAVDEPVTPWIFPLDLPVEWLRWMLEGPVSVRARLALRRRTPPVEGVVPPEVFQLRRRARNALLER